MVSTGQTGGQSISSFSDSRVRGEVNLTMSDQYEAKLLEKLTVRLIFQFNHEIKLILAGQGQVWINSAHAQYAI